MVSVRGWLECDEEQLARIKEIVTADDPESTYSGGWAFPARQYNFVKWAFYGADIRAVALEWFEDRLRRIAEIPASFQDEEYDERPRGLFLVSHEVDGMSEWRVRDGVLVIGRPEGDYRYLDA
ncbi:hypothetical protein [Streptomyces sp. NPDC093970]|uniref:hypothetical protein n=1 Tax=Streptomyces sp. NPDC093970 TaxID=3155076 RepID=UPI003431466F